MSCEGTMSNSCPYRENTWTSNLVLCLLLLITPFGQILVHTIADSGIWHLFGLSDANVTNNEQSIGGLLANYGDNLVYASLALQNGKGFYLTINLYTTALHTGALVNLYFLSIGLLSNLLNVQPLSLMISISFLSAPFVGFTVFLLCRHLKFNYPTSLLAVAMVILGSGPSWVLSRMNLMLEFIGVALPTGNDMWYSDLFPVNTFLTLPYQSFGLMFQVVVLSAILKALRTDLAGNSSGWILFSAAALALFALIRPYEAFVLAALFPLTMFAARLAQGKNVFFRYHDYFIIGTLVGPCLGYILWVSFLPGYRSWVHSATHLLATRREVVVGCSVFWVFAIIGIVKVVRDKRLDMLFLCLWAVLTVLLLIGRPSAFIKFAGGAVIAYGILGAFGLDHLLSSLAVYFARWRLGRQAILRGLGGIAVAILLIATSLHTYWKIPYQHQPGVPRSGVPRFDTEILAAAAVIRQETPHSIPVVLTDCSTAYLLPGLSAARVYAGHWGLTPDFDAKCSELAIAGFGEQPDPTASLNEDRLREIVAKTKPDFVLIKRGARAERWLLAHHAASAKTTGQRWSLMVVGRQ